MDALPFKRGLAVLGICVATVSMTGVGHGDEGGPLLDRYPLDAGGAGRSKLSRKLDEISGLAVTRDGRVLAHEDQNGIVYEIDPTSGELAKAFTLDTPAVKADFEGIAVAGDRLYLVTSKGRLYEVREGTDGESVRYNSYDTGVDAHCAEIEGLATDDTGVLLLPCKSLRGDAREREVQIYRWSPSLRAAAEPPTIRIDAARLVSPGETHPFRPSAIEWDARSGRILLLSSAPDAIAEISAEGVVMALRLLPPGKHRQPEGLALTIEGDLLIADEGAGKRPRLTRYPPRPSVDAQADPDEH